MHQGQQFKYKIPHNLPEPKKGTNDWFDFAMNRGAYAPKHALPDKPSEDSLTYGELRFEESDMPSSHAYMHKGVRTSGEPRRVHAIDPFEDRSYRIGDKGHLEEHSEGVKGLVGYADVYRGGESTNVGFINSAKSGTGRNLMHHLLKTTPEDKPVHLGMASDTMENLAQQINRDSGNQRVTYSGQD